MADHIGRHTLTMTQQAIARGAAVTPPASGAGAAPGASVSGKKQVSPFADDCVALVE
jgi:hypothetical protein